jgi:hypothetical protein
MPRTLTAAVPRTVPHPRRTATRVGLQSVATRVTVIGGPVHAAAGARPAAQDPRMGQSRRDLRRIHAAGDVDDGAGGEHGQPGPGVDVGVPGEPDRGGGEVAADAVAAVRWPPATLSVCSVSPAITRDSEARRGPIPGPDVAGIGQGPCPGGGAAGRLRAAGCPGAAGSGSFRRARRLRYSRQVSQARAASNTVRAVSPAEKFTAVIR